MADRPGVIRTAGFVGVLACVAWLAGCGDGSGGKLECTRVNGVWDVTMSPCPGYPAGLFQTWTIAQAECAVTITADEPDLTGILIGDFTVRGHVTEGDLWATWVSEAGQCRSENTLDVSVTGSTFSGTIKSFRCLQLISCQVVASRR